MVKKNWKKIIENETIFYEKNPFVITIDTNVEGYYEVLIEELQQTIRRRTFKTKTLAKKYTKLFMRKH